MLPHKEGDMTHAPEPSEDPGAEARDSELDTEGHSLANGEFTNSTLRDRQREDAQYARDAANRRELHKQPSRSLRSRIFGR